MLLSSTRSRCSMICLSGTAAIMTEKLTNPGFFFFFNYRVLLVISNVRRRQHKCSTVCSTALADGAAFRQTVSALNQDEALLINKYFSYRY